MNEYKWMMLVLCLIWIAVNFMSLTTARAMHAQLKRSDLPVFVGSFVSWCLFGYFFSGIFLVAFVASVAVAYLPPIIRMLRLS